MEKESGADFRPIQPWPAGSGRYNRAVNLRNQPAAPVTSASALLRSAAGLQLIGIDVRPALAQIGLAPEQLGELGKLIPLYWLRDFWDAVVKETGQSGLGLRIAEQVRPEAYEVFGCLLAASSTLGEAALRATRLISLATKTVRFSLLHEGDQVTFAVEPFYPDLVHRETIEFMVGALGVVARRIADRPLPGQGVCFTHPEPDDLTHHRRLFTAQIHFGASFNGLVFDGSLLDLPIPSSDSTLSTELRRQAEELMARDQMIGFTAQVRAALAVELRGGDPSAERVAGALALHPKTLSRRLKAEGTTFRRLLDELRMELARRYLRQPGLSIEEVAFLLGYSERSAFHRAFQRWTGHAPRAESN
jgi:AraC-like DNA-binding protein